MRGTTKYTPPGSARYLQDKPSPAQHQPWKATRASSRLVGHAFLRKLLAVVHAGWRAGTRGGDRRLVDDVGFSAM
jgi:hypothetical protein